MRIPVLATGLVLVLATTAAAQTTLNPDISVVGDFRGYTHDDESRLEEKEKLNLTDPSLELVAGGYLNPYARADAVIAWHGEHNAEIEEAYATIVRGLPLGMNLRVGQYYLEFGRLNPVHEHAWSFIERPLPHAEFFGEEGLRDVAIRTSFLLPTGSAYTEVMAGLIQGDALIGHHHDEEEAEEGHEHVEPDRWNPGVFGRLATSFAVSDHAELALGTSVLNASYGVAEHHHHEEEEETEAELEADPQQLRAWVGGVDLKYKYKPSRYTSLQIEAEGLLRSEEQTEGDDLTSYGGYGYVDYRFNQKYNVGGIFEYVSRKSAAEHEEGEEEEHGASSVTVDTWRAGLFVGFAPIEETSLVRLAGHYTDPDDADGFWEMTLQFVFSLGPHQPHNF